MGSCSGGGEVKDKRYSAVGTKEVKVEKRLLYVQ
jgi:hypothetical protein